MRIIVTGASGHVGTAVVQRLDAQGHDIIGLCRSQCSHLPSHIKLCHVTLGTPEALGAILATGPFDCIIHTAACLSMVPGDPEVVATNQIGTQQIAQAATGCGAHTLIFFSSISVCSPTGPISEDSPTQPSSEYSASKLYGEGLVQDFSTSGRCGVSFRLSSPVGPGLKYNRIFRIFVRQALENQPIVLDGQGGRRQNYIDVRDAAHAVEHAITNQVSGIYNLAGKTAISNLELARLCIDTLGSSSTIEFSGHEDPAESLSWDITLDKAQRDMHYDPIYTIEDSIRSLAKELCL